MDVRQYWNSTDGFQTNFKFIQPTQLYTTAKYDTKNYRFRGKWNEFRIQCPSHISHGTAFLKGELISNLKNINMPYMAFKEEIVTFSESTIIFYAHFRYAAKYKIHVTIKPHDTKEEIELKFVTDKVMNYSYISRKRIMLEEKKNSLKPEINLNNYLEVRDAISYAKNRAENLYRTVGGFKMEQILNHLSSALIEMNDLIESMTKTQNNFYNPIFNNLNNFVGVVDSPRFLGIVNSPLYLGIPDYSHSILDFEGVTPNWQNETLGLLERCNESEMNETPTKSYYYAEVSMNDTIEFFKNNTSIHFKEIDRIKDLKKLFEQNIKIAVLIGIDEYEMIQHLNGAINFIERAKRFYLEKDYFVIIMKNSNAKRETILKIFNFINRMANSHYIEHLILHFSGHGRTRQWKENCFENCLVPYDSGFGLANRDISELDLRSWLFTIYKIVGQCVLILDCCFAPFTQLSNSSHECSIKDDEYYKFSQQVEDVIHSGFENVVVLTTLGCKKWNGALSKFLYEKNIIEDSDITFHEIIQKFNKWNHESKSEHLQIWPSSAQFRMFWKNEGKPIRPYYTLEFKNERIKISAGRLHAIQEGMQFIASNECKWFVKENIEAAIYEVKTVELNYCICELVSGESKKSFEFAQLLNLGLNPIKIYNPNLKNSRLLSNEMNSFKTSYFEFSTNKDECRLHLVKISPNMKSTTFYKEDELEGYPFKDHDEALLAIRDVKDEIWLSRSYSLSNETEINVFCQKLQQITLSTHYLNYYINQAKEHRSKIPIYISIDGDNIILENVSQFNFEIDKNNPRKILIHFENSLDSDIYFNAVNISLNGNVDFVSPSRNLIKSGQTFIANIKINYEDIKKKYINERIILFIYDKLNNWWNVNVLLLKFDLIENGSRKRKLDITENVQKKKKDEDTSVYVYEK